VWAASVPVVAHQRRRVEVGDVLVDQISLEGAVDRIRAFLLAGVARQVVTVNMDFLSIASRDAAFRETINQADLAVADGMPLVWLSRMHGEALPERVAGVELVDGACRLAAELGQGVYLLGARPGVADAAARELQAGHPGLQIAGTYAPPHRPLTADEDDRMTQRIRDTSPGLLLVALGAPRQDLWIRSHKANLGVRVAMGVGCTFDVLAGTLERAPGWMQRAGMEWAFRLGHEPGRLWRRYLVRDLPVFTRLLISSARPPHSRDAVLPA
jgi:N-acetylglucosaminyldiphosphoundecaprenol N-acetyl-beta-D-mannosaminyltransferase